MKLICLPLIQPYIHVHDTTRVKALARARASQRGGGRPRSLGWSVSFLLFHGCGKSSNTNQLIQKHTR